MKETETESKEVPVPEKKPNPFARATEEKPKEGTISTEKKEEEPAKKPLFGGGTGLFGG